MIIKSAEFAKSSPDVGSCPPADKAEFAFIGRSNVGKSSLINAFLNKRSLAKTSGKPGKTKLINHFLINGEWYLVDLPGYGYAQISKGEREQFEKLIQNYILERKSLVNLYVLIDLRHKAMQIDLEFMEWLGECQIPFTIVFTKSDKLSKMARKKQVEAYQSTMLEKWEAMPSFIVTSSETGAGIDQLHSQIEEYKVFFKE